MKPFHCIWEEKPDNGGVSIVLSELSEGLNAVTNVTLARIYLYTIKLLHDYIK